MLCHVSRPPSAGPTSVASVVMACRETCVRLLGILGTVNTEVAADLLARSTEHCLNADVPPPDSLTELLVEKLCCMAAGGRCDPCLLKSRPWWQCQPEPAAAVLLTLMVHLVQPVSWSITEIRAPGHIMIAIQHLLARVITSCMTQSNSTIQRPCEIFAGRSGCCQWRQALWTQKMDCCCPRDFAMPPWSWF